MSAPKATRGGWTPTEEQLRRVAEEIPLRALDMLVAEEAPRLNPGQRPRMLEAVARGVWQASPAPDLVAALEEIDRSTEHLIYIPGMAKHAEIVQGICRAALAKARGEART